jgi:hypothetical protein
MGRGGPPVSSPRRHALTALRVAGLAAVLSAIPAHADEPVVEFVVVRSDTLIGLSKSVLVSPTAWREVARLNRLRDPNLILQGQHLRIPARLLRADAASSTLLSVVGDVRTDGAAATAGSALAEGQSVQTGPNGSAVVELADGSRVQVAPSSLAQVAASRRYGERKAPANMSDTAGTAAQASGGWFAGTMRVLRGSIEVFATRVLRSKPLEVVTPTAVVGVRGTRYRVGFDEAEHERSHAEVIEGSVRFEPAGDRPAGVDVRAGFGASTDARPGRAGTASIAPLLDPPGLAAVPARFERPVVHFALPDETAALRVQVAADGAFEQVVSDQLVPAGAEVRIAGLDDAQWHLRARRIDGRGIEGRDAERTFVLKARPEPPAYRAPRSGAKQVVGGVEFAWAQNVGAPQAHLQIAEDAEFSRIVEDRDHLDTATVRVDLPAAGAYHWRLASIRAGGDQGPYGDPQRFELRALPEPASAARSGDGNALVFRFGGRPGDRQQVQLARDPDFVEIVGQDDLPGVEWTLPMPSRGGRYYFRYRSVEPDGFVGPYSERLMIEVPRDWSPWLLLLPLVILL